MIQKDYKESEERERHSLRETEKKEKDALKCIHCGG